MEHSNFGTNDPSPPSARSVTKTTRKSTATQSRTWQDELINDNCLNVLPLMPENVVDLVITSPPYADSRKKTYGGIPADEYVDWFLPISAELLRVLKPDGTFILNIKEGVTNGERQTYVMELIVEMRKQGWLWTEEFIWHKKNCHPGKWPNRFRDAWERCLQFNKSRTFAMYQDEVKVPVGNWAKSRLKNLSETDRRRDNSRVNSGFGKNVSNWLGRDMVYPSNVLHMASETGNKGHSATFPRSLPEWFINLFTKESDLVLDPFVGSGTSAIAARLLNRHYLGIDLIPEYIAQAEKTLQDIPQRLRLSKTNGR